MDKLSKVDDCESDSEQKQKLSLLGLNLPLTVVVNVWLADIMGSLMKEGHV